MNVDDEVQVEAHPPERGQGSMILASGCCTCCCCCSCCLHSVGAAAGVAVAASMALASDALAAKEDTKKPLVPPGMVVAGVALVTAIASLAVLGLGSSDLEVAGLGLALLFPLLIGGVLVVALPVAALGGQRGIAVWAKLLLGLISGTVMGTVLMVAIFLVLAIVGIA